MNKYLITNPISGIELGVYEGEDEFEAYSLMMKEAGYKDTDLEGYCMQDSYQNSELKIKEII